MKRGVKLLSLVLSVVFLLSILTSFASAEITGAFKPLGDMAISAGNTLVDILNPIFKYLIGDSTGFSGAADSASTGIFLARILMLIIVYAVAFIALGKTGFFETEMKWAKALIALGVGFLGVRFLDNGFVYNVILSNAAFAVAVTALLPFVLFFFIVRDWTPTARRISWIFFAVAMFLLYSTMTTGTTGTTGQSAVLNGTAAGFYPIVAILALLMAIFDGTIKKLSVRMQGERAGAEAANEAILEQKRKLAQAHKDYATDGVINKAQYNERVAAIKAKIAEISKSL